MQFKALNGGAVFEFRGDSLFYRSDLIVKTPDGDTKNFPVRFVDQVFTCDLGEYGFYREKILDSDEVLAGEIEFVIKTDKPFIVQCPFSFTKNHQTPWFMIPGFLYGTNNLATSDGPQPKFDYGGKVGWPKSSKFYLRADRSTHPGIITVKGGKASLVGIGITMNNRDGAAIEKPGNKDDKWAPGYFYNGLMLDSDNAERNLIGFQLGYENAPGRFSWQKDGVPAADLYLFGWLEGLKGKTIRTNTIYAAVEAPNIPAYGRLLEKYYRKIHQFPGPRSTREEALEKISGAIIDYSWNKEAKGFVLVDEELTGCDIAWTGGMQVAYPLLKAARKTGKDRLRDIAYEYIDNMCQTAMNEKAGLLNEEFRDGKWNVTGWWGVREDCFNFGDDPLHSAYLNGQASYYLLKSYELEGAKQDHWLETARVVLETAIRNQREDGALPVFFDPATGDAVDYDGFQPCWFVPGLVLLNKFTGEQKYLDAAKKALDHYYTWHLKGELYNTPMDTHRGVDQEGNLAFVVASVEFHKLLGEQKYLDYARVGLDWDFSWKFPYNTVYSNEPLRSMNWSTSGGCITSTHNPSIHQMGNLIAGEIYYIYQQTGDEYIAQRLRDTCIWGTGTYNTKDNDFTFGKTGQATEQFTYSDGVVLPWPYPWDGGIWAASLSWASACVLLSCAEDIPDSFFK